MKPDHFKQNKSTSVNVGDPVRRWEWLGMIKFIFLIILKTIIALLLFVVTIFLLYGILLVRSFNSQGINELFYFILIAIIYLLPFIICRINKHPSQKIITILSLAGVIVGPAWAIAFVWSLTKSVPNRKAIPAIKAPVGEQKKPKNTSDIYQ